MMRSFMLSDQSSIYDEEDLLPISALQHLMFCERQWALIHLEQIWEENRLTAEGQLLHEKVHTPNSESKKNIKISRSLQLRSLKLGLIGVADIVEFHPNENEILQPYPIEYKRGKPKKDLIDSVQLCAQALCLEEMLRYMVPKEHSFMENQSDASRLILMRNCEKKLFRLIQRLHQVANAKKTPRANFEKKCTSCSLINWCMPTCTNGSKNIEQYLNKIIKWASEDHEG